MTFNPNKNISFANIENSEEKEYKYKLNEDNFNINDIIIILKQLIDKIKYNLDIIKDNNLNNKMMNNKKFVDKVLEIKNNVIKVFDKIIEEETFKLNEIKNNDKNYSNNFKMI